MGFFKIKKIIILSSVLFLCGCSATYDLEINDNVIKENAKILILKDELSYKEKNGFTLQEELDYTYQSIHDINNGQEEIKTRSFNIEKIDDGVYGGLKYANSYKLDNFSNSSLIRQCYEKVNINNNDSLFSVKTSDYFKCFDYYNYVDNVKISLKTDYKVEANNADEYNDGVYYWIITRENYKKSDIKFQVNTAVNVNQQSAFVDQAINIGFLIIGGLLIIVVIYVFIKVKNSNKK